jgi:glutaredoxin
MNKKIKKNNKIIFGIILFVIIIGILYYIKPSNSNTPNSLKDNLAQCLTKNGAKMYGTDWCSHCQQQKELFGESFKYINYIECEQNKAKCDEANIEGYPTWIINNQKYPGVQSLDQLKKMGGC